MNIEDLISQYIDGALSSEAEAELHHRLALSPEARQLFRAHIMLRGLARDQRAMHAPTGEMRSRLFERLQQEEGMALPELPVEGAAVSIPASSGPAPGASGGVPRSIPSKNVAGSSRRRRILPWLIPIAITAMVAFIFLNQGVEEGKVPTVAGNYDERPAGSASDLEGDMSNPSAPGSAGSGTMTDQSAPESSMSDNAAGERSVGNAPARDMAASSASPSDASASEEHASGSGATLGETAQGGAGIESLAAARKPEGPKVLSHEEARRTTTRSVPSETIASNQSPVLPEGMGGRIIVPPSPRTNIQDAVALQNSVSSMRQNNGINIRGGRSSESNIRVDGFEISESISSSSSDSLWIGSALAAQQEGNLDSQRDMALDFSLSSPAANERHDGVVDSDALTLNDDVSAKKLESSPTIARNEEELGDREEGQQILRNRTGNFATMTPPPSMAPPPPSAPSGVADQYRGNMAMENEAEANKPEAADGTIQKEQDVTLQSGDGSGYKTSEGSDENMSVTSAREKSNAEEKTKPASRRGTIGGGIDSPLEAAPAPRVILLIGAQENSLYGIETGDVHFQVALKFGVEFGGAHQIYGMVGGSGYDEVLYDSVTHDISGVPVVSGEVKHETASRFNELFGAFGYRYMVVLGRDLSMAVGAWAGAGSRYMRFGAEIPVIFQINRWVRVEAAPGVQYARSRGGDSSTEVISPGAGSQGRQRTWSLERDTDVQIGIAVGATVIW